MQRLKNRCPGVGRHQQDEIAHMLPSLKCHFLRWKCLKFPVLLLGCRGKGHFRVELLQLCSVLLYGLGSCSEVGRRDAGGGWEGSDRWSRDCSAATPEQGCARLLPPARQHRAWETQVCSLQHDVKATLLPPAFCPLSGWSGCNENCCFIPSHPVFSPSSLPPFPTASLFRALHPITPFLFYSYNGLHFFCITDYFLATQIPPQSTLSSCLVWPHPSLAQEPIHGWAEETVLVFSDYFHCCPSSWRI